MRLPLIRGSQPRMPFPDPTEEASRCRSCVAANPADAEAHLLLAFSLQRLGQHKEAIPEFRQAIALYEREAQCVDRLSLGMAHEALASALMGCSEEEAARLHLEQALALFEAYYQGAADRLSSTSCSWLCRRLIVSLLDRSRSQHRQRLREALRRIS